MNFKILLLVIIAGIGVTSYGALSNQMTLDIQKFELVILPPMDGTTVDGATEFSGVQCSCRDPDDPNGLFSPGFCNVLWITPPNDGPDMKHGTPDDFPGDPDPNSLGTNGNTLCTWEASSTIYGDLLDYDEGCSANYWLKSSDPTSIDYSWPIGYQPDYFYEDIFQIGLNVIDDKKGKKTVSIDDENEIQKFTEAYEMYVTNLEKLLENKRIDTKTAMTLKWLLNAIPSPDEEGYSKIASSKLDSFNDRLDLLVERNHLTQEDKEFIHGIEEELDEIVIITDTTTEHKFTLLDALSNDVLRPSDKQIAKQSVAAILNSAHFQVTYHYSVAEIMQMAQDGISNEDQIKTANEFKKHNLAGGSPICPNYGE